MMGLGWQELTIILVIVVIIFGAGKLPEIGSGLGKGIRGFKEESGLGEDEKKKAGDAIESGTSRTSSTLTASARDSRETVADQIEADKRERNIRADEI
jgi:sec-independent protein translocase protein TatA